MSTRPRPASTAASGGVGRGDSGRSRAFSRHVAARLRGDRVRPGLRALVVLGPGVSHRRGLAAGRADPINRIIGPMIRPWGDCTEPPGARAQGHEGRPCPLQPPPDYARWDGNRARGPGRPATRLVAANPTGGDEARPVASCWPGARRRFPLDPGCISPRPSHSTGSGPRKHSGSRGARSDRLTVGSSSSGSNRLARSPASAPFQPRHERPKAPTRHPQNPRKVLGKREPGLLRVSRVRRDGSSARFLQVGTTTRRVAGPILPRASAHKSQVITSKSLAISCQTSTKSQILE